jgi:PAS domain S-box-containing protein
MANKNIDSNELVSGKDTIENYMDLGRIIFITINPDEKVSSINQAGVDILGYKNKDEIIGKNWFANFIPRSDIVKTREIFKNIITGNLKLSEYFENKILTKDKNEKYIAWHNSARLDDKGTVLYTIGFGMDISSKLELEKELKKSEEFNRIITENSSDLMSILTFDINPKFLYLSPSHERILGLKPNDWLGRPGLEMVHPDDRLKLLGILKPYLKNKLRMIVNLKISPIHERVEYRVANIKGKYLGLETTADLFGDKILLIARDITERKKAETELKKKNEELERFTRIAVDREMKMVELKRKIEELENKLKKAKLDT